MSTNQKVDLRQWVFQYHEPDGGLKVVPLKTGALFPERLDVTGRYKSGPLLSLRFKVEEGQPTLISLTMGQENDLGDPVTPSVVHGLPLGQLLDSTIGRMAEAMRLFQRSAEQVEAGLPARFPNDSELDEARRSAVASQSGRPVPEENLRRVAEIVRANSYNPRVDIHDEFHVSTRTASRWIDEARKRGFLTEED